MGAAKSKPLGPTVAGIFAGLLLLSSVLIAVLALPDALRERRAYEQAPVCTSGRPTEDCRRHVKAAVVGKLEYALASREVAPGELIHHADHGCQYTSVKLTTRLLRAGVQASMGSVGDSFDNALAENL
jgi:transposase InsO family protein